MFLLRPPLASLGRVEVSLGSVAQQDRHRRILDATISLASEGGFDAVQMRAVAERADVALGTLYRYFPSKIHLLVSALAREFERSQEELAGTTIPGATPHARVMHVLGRTTTYLKQDPHLTEALTRAFMFADASVSTEIHQVGSRARRGGRRDRQGDRRRLAGRARRLGHRAHQRRRGGEVTRRRRPPAAPLGR